MELDVPAQYNDLESPEESYHSVSMLAAAVLVLGLLSPLAFAHELLWALPVVGAALALVAIYRIDRSDGALIGRKAAVVGLVLCLFFGLGAVTQALTRHLWLASRANRVAERFVELLRQGDSRAAHQLWTAPRLRLPADGNLSEYYEENPEAAKEYDAFVKNEVVKSILSLGPNARIERQNTHLASSEATADYLSVLYHLSGDTPDGPIDMEARLSVFRYLEPDGSEQWRVYTAEVPLD